MPAQWPNRPAAILAGVICPHCRLGVAPNWTSATLGGDPEFGQLDASIGNCPNCERLLVKGTFRQGPHIVDAIALWPADQSRPVPPGVDGEYAEDFREAAAIVNLSPKGSAAVSRRLLQHIIREKADIRKGDLNQEIDALIESNQLPADLANDLDMIRTTGNFAAHTTKGIHTGEIVSVEAGEAEALLDLLEELLDFYFVRPAVREKKRAAWNEKLAAAGKPPLKGTDATPSDEPPPTPG